MTGFCDGQFLQVTKRRKNQKRNLEGREGPVRGETEDCGYQEAMGKKRFPEEEMTSYVSAAKRSHKTRTEN